MTQCAPNLGPRNGQRKTSASTRRPPADHASGDYQETTRDQQETNTKRRPGDQQENQKTTTRKGTETNKRPLSGDQEETSRKPQGEHIVGRLIESLIMKLL